MKILTITCLFLMVAASATAARHKLNINGETPEGQLLTQIGQEADAAKKMELMEQFLAKFPADANAPWVMTQMQPEYLKASQFDKALAMSQKLIAIDPEDVEMAHGALKAAEGKKDIPLIIQWSNQTSVIAKKVVASKQPAEEEEVEIWKQRVDFAKEVDTYTEYAVYAQALQATDPDQKQTLIDALEKRNPQNQYLPALRAQMFALYRQAGNMDKAAAAAETVLAKDPNNEDMILFLMDYSDKKNDPDKVISYAAKVIQVVSTKPKPEGVADADWDKRKTTILGLAHWMSGMRYAGQNKFVPADKELREALPLVKDNEQMLAPALFQLGLVNFKLGDTAKPDQKRILDAYKYWQQCLAIKSTYQAQAKKNVGVIQTKYRLK